MVVCFILFFILPTIATCVYKTEEKQHCIVEESVVYIYEEQDIGKILRTCAQWFLNTIMHVSGSTPFRTSDWSSWFPSATMDVIVVPSLNHHVQVEGWR